MTRLDTEPLPAICSSCVEEMTVSTNAAADARERQRESEETFRRMGREQL